MIRRWLWLLWTMRRRRDTRVEAEGAARLRLEARDLAAAEKAARERIEGRWSARQAELDVERRARELEHGRLLHCLWRWTKLRHAAAPTLRAVTRARRRRSA